MSHSKIRIWVYEFPSKEKGKADFTAEFKSPEKMRKWLRENGYRKQNQAGNIWEHKHSNKVVITE